MEILYMHSIQIFCEEGQNWEVTPIKQQEVHQHSSSDFDKPKYQMKAYSSVSLLNVVISFLCDIIFILKKPAGFITFAICGR